MLRALKNRLLFAANDKSRRRRHQFTPSIALSASNLEERALLSAAGGAAATAHQAAVEARHAAQVARHEARTEARHEARLERQEARLARHEAKLVANNPSSAKAAAMARTMSSLQAAIAADPSVSVSPTGAVTVTGPTGTIVSGVPGASGTTTSGSLTYPGSIVGTTGSTSVITPASTLGTLSGLNTATIGVSPTLPGGLINSVAGSFANGIPNAFVSSTGTPSILSGNLSQGGAFFSAPTGVSVTTGNTVSSLSSVSGTTSTGTLTQVNYSPTTTATGLSSVSPLATLLMGGSVPTAGLSTAATGLSTTATGGATGLTPVSVLTFTPTLTTTGAQITGTSFNPSPLPLNGTLPFTGTPFNPSPLPLNGTLPFTGSPINPSPIPFTGTLA